MSSFLAQLQAAATEAQTVLADMTGGTTVTLAGLGNLTVSMVISAPDAAQQGALGHELTDFGHRRRALLIGTATKTQFTVSPRALVNTTATLAGATYTGDVKIHEVHTDEDPLHYIFVFMTAAPPPV